MIKFRLEIMNKTWEVSYLTKKAFEKKYGPRVLAVSEVDDRLLALRTDALTQETTLHELLHCYVHEYSATVMDLSAAQMEELCCDIVGKHASVMLEQSININNAYKVLRGQRLS